MESYKYNNVLMMNFHEFQLKISKFRVKFRLFTVLLSLRTQIQLNVSNRAPSKLSEFQWKLLNCYATPLLIECFPKFYDRLLAVFPNEVDSGSYKMKPCRIQPAKNVEWCGCFCSQHAKWRWHKRCKSSAKRMKYIRVGVYAHLAHITPESE